MLKIALKDLRQFFTDKRSILLTFIVPIPLISLFSIMFGGAGAHTEARPQTLVVCDEDRTDVSKKIVAQLDSAKELDVIQTAPDTALAWIKSGEQSSALVLHKGLKDSIEAGKSLPLELEYDKAKEMEIGILQGALMGNLMKAVGSKAMEKKAIAQFDAGNPVMPDEMRAIIHKQIAQNFSGGSDDNRSVLRATPIYAQEENTPGLVQAVAGTAVMMLLFSVSAMGATILDEKQEGTLKRLLYSPLRPTHILYGKMFFSTFIAICQLVIMLTFSSLVFGLQVSKYLPQLSLLVVASAFACSGFGMLLASFARARQQVQGLATLVILPMSAIGGSMVPLFAMPAFMKKIAVVSVNYWSVDAFYDVLWRNLPLTDPGFLTKIGVLVAIGLGLNLLAVRMFSRNVLKLA